MTARKLSSGCHLGAAALLAAAVLWIDASPGFAQSGRQRTAPHTQKATSLDARLELMLRTMRIARDWHIEGPSKSVLIAGAIEGLLARVDPEAELYSRADLRRIARFTPGGGAGVGLDVFREPAERRNERKGYRVIAARDGSAAARVGLKAGDLITHVDDQPAGDVPYLVMTQAMLDGPAGSTVRVTVERADSDLAAEHLTLQRSVNFGADLTVDEVVPGITRIRVASLSERTAGALARAWAAHAGTGPETRLVRGVVLDLRSTVATATGGIEGARAVADAFLQTEPLLRMVSRHEAEPRRERATPGDLVEGRPLVVLVDGGTSGAVEMLASALQEAHRARVVGTKTAGRGAIRTLVALDHAGRKPLLRMTTRRLATPAGAAIDGKGIVPEIGIEQLPASARCGVRDIENASANGICVPRTLVQDTQLQRAISTLDEPLVASQQTPAASSEQP